MVWQLCKVQASVLPCDCGSAGCFYVGLVVVVDLVVAPSWCNIEISEIEVSVV